MEAFLKQINLEAFGVYAVTVAVLLYWIHSLREDLRDEREYSRKQRDTYQGLAMKTIETMGRLEQAFMLLKDGLR